MLEHYGQNIGVQITKELFLLVATEQRSDTGYDY